MKYLPFLILLLAGSAWAGPPPLLPTPPSDAAYDAGTWDGNTDAATKNAIRDKIETLAGGHDAVTLGADFGAIFGLTGQELTVDTATANYVLAGPVSGAAADPTMRALVAADIPDISATYLAVAGTDTVKDTHIDWGAGAGQVNSADIGAEPALGNPGVTGYVLSSTDAGVRSWVAQSAGVGDFLADGTVAMTGAPVPNAANTIALGSNAAEWADIFFGDGAVISGQNDQSATLTSSASLWTANNFAVTTQFKLPSSNADVTATAGYIRHDSTVTNFTNGALLYYNGAATKQLVDMTAATAGACTDDQVVAYDADNDLWYCKADTGGAGDITSAGDCSTGACTADAILADEAVSPTGGTWDLSAVTLTLPSLTGGLTIADSQVLTFDESAANPNDADVQLSATDGVFKVASANGANNEDFTIDTDGAADTVTFASSTGATSIIGLANYSLGAAGVKLTGDGDGAITLLGLGNGSDEDLTINLDDVANTATITSSTGLVDIDASTMELSTRLNEVIKTSSATLTAQETAGTVITNYGETDDADLILTGLDIDTLPGHSFVYTIVAAMSTNDTCFKAAADNLINFEGTNGANNGCVCNAAPALGDKLTCYAITTGASVADWFCEGTRGTWAAVADNTGDCPD